MKNIDCDNQVTWLRCELNTYLQC